MVVEGGRVRGNAVYIDRAGRGRVAGVGHAISS